MLEMANRYFWFFTITVALSLQVLIIVNAAIDPLSALDSPKFHGLNIEKTRLSVSGGRRYKASEIERIKPDILILGSSRVEVGVPTWHEGFGDAVVYNAGLSGTNMIEIERVLDFALSQGRPREVLLGLDFLAFSDRRSFGADYYESAFADSGKGSKIFGILKYLISLSTASQSIGTIKDNLQGKKSDYDRTGVNRHFEGLRAPNHRQLFDSVLRDQFFINLETYAGYAYSEDRMHAVMRIMEKCASEGIVLRVFITPVHARQLEAIRALGLGELYYQWIRGLVENMMVLRQSHPRAEVYLWDFSGYHQFATEIIPAAEEPDKKMMWYWESSHFKLELGSLVLDRMYDGPGAASLPSDFGVRLDEVDVETWLREQENQRDAYSVKQKEEVSWVMRNADCTSRIWGRLCRDCKRMTGFQGVSASCN